MSLCSLYKWILTEQTPPWSQQSTRFCNLTVRRFDPLFKESFEWFAIYFPILFFFMLLVFYVFQYAVQHLRQILQSFDSCFFL